MDGSAPSMRPSERMVSTRSRLLAHVISAETMLPRATPLRVTSPLKWPKRCRASSASVPAAEAVAMLSPCATRLAVAVSSPERCICQLSVSSTQPEYIA